MARNSEGKPKSEIDTIWQVDLVQQAYKRLLDAIVRGELRPGDRLVEGELARRLGVSRGPVREAARLLERSGFVRSEPRRGFFVRSVVCEDVGSLYELRCCIEAFAARTVAAHMTPGDKKRLNDLYAELKAAASTNDRPLECMELTFSLHRILCELTGNSRILEVFDNIVWQTRQIVTLTNLADETASAFLVEHNEAVIEAINTGDPRVLEDTIVRYMDIMRESTVEYFSRYDEGANRALE